MKVYNTLSRQKEEFTAGEVVRMYVCGITPYDECHLGHAMSYIIFDTIRRYLEFRGYRVKYVQNFTDVDDKIIDRAHIQRLSISELSSRFIERYFADMDALEIQRADVYPKATEEIPKMLEIIQGLMGKGYAYEALGSVYFRVNRFPDYGKLSGCDLSKMESTGDAEPGKENFLDFALWKSSKSNEPSWLSPWGEGRPGWHIECSAMSLRHLGETVDIHGGGRDLVFPHHENEIAQSEAFTGVNPFARYWLHNGMVQMGEEKMSKSMGNLVTVRDLLSRYTPDAIRFLILSSHYRSPLTYSEVSLGAAENGVERLRQAVHRKSKEGRDSGDYQFFRQRFIEAMDDDFNTPQALAALFDLAREINRGAEEGVRIAEGQENLQELAHVLGLTLADLDSKVDTDQLHKLAASISRELKKVHHQGPAIGLDLGFIDPAVIGPSGDTSKVIDALVKVREQLRVAKAWQHADSVRSRLSEMDIYLEDTPRPSFTTL